MAETATIASHIGPGLKSQPGFNFFSLFFVRIHTNEFIQLLYKLCSTNSYTVWFLCWKMRVPVRHLSSSKLECRPNELARGHFGGASKYSVAINSFVYFIS